MLTLCYPIRIDPVIFREDAMNPRAKRINVRPCIVCGYPFSDRHHPYPRRDGGKETIFLCPNHHRFANIFQNIFIMHGLLGEKRAKEFALENFDKEFNEKMLDELIRAYFDEVEMEHG